MVAKPQAIGALRERIDIQIMTPSKDAMGAPILVPSTLSSTWAEVRQASSGETFRRQQTQSSAAWTIVVRYRSDLTPQMRIVWRNRTFQVKGMESADLRRRFLELACEELSVTNLQ